MCIRDRSSAAVWASYQPTYSDGLSSIDPSKWTQNGNLSAASNGIGGNGSLISTVSVPTGADYDVSMTIHTANQGACSGSYSLYARSTPNGATAYVLTLSAGSIGLFREVANSWTLLSSMPYPCADGMVMRLVVRGSSLTFWSGPNTAAYQDVAPITTGQPGVGISSSEGDTIANVQLGPIDYLPPAAVNASAIETSTAPNRVDLRWPASAPDANSAGLQGYVVYRDGVYLGSTRAPNWLDQTVSGPESTAYSIYAADQHGSVSAPAQVTVQVPADPGAKPKTGAAAEIVLRKPSAKNVPDGPTADQREIGVMPTGSYWGAAGENIDLLSGNLNFSIPLIKAMGRGNSSVTFNLSYNSQMWRQDTSIWLLGQDVGLGLGWKLQAGSIEPMWYGGSELYYLYTDATGAQYVLDQSNPYTNVWTSLQTYVWYDANADILHFPDGSFWNMNVVSALVEQDGGTQYPSQMEDSNGNFITLTYGPAIGYPYYDTNTSSRITIIYDARGNPQEMCIRDSADGFAQGQLGGPRATSRHQQAGDVGAGDQQDQRRRAHQHQQRAAHISHHYLGEEFSMTVVVALRPGVDFRQVAHNRVEIRSGGGERDPWLQSPDTADRTMLPAAGRFALEPAQRKVIIRASQCPQRSRHAGNLVRFAVDRQGGSDDVRIAAELALPELMAQHDQRGRAGKVVLRAEEAAEERVLSLIHI